MYACKLILKSTPSCSICWNLGANAELCFRFPYKLECGRMFIIGLYLLCISQCCNDQGGLLTSMSVFVLKVGQTSDCNNKLYCGEILWNAFPDPLIPNSNTIICTPRYHFQVMTLPNWETHKQGMIKTVTCQHPPPHILVMQYFWTWKFHFVAWCSFMLVCNWCWVHARRVWLRPVSWIRLMPGAVRALKPKGRGQPLAFQINPLSYSSRLSFLLEQGVSKLQPGTKFSPPQDCICPTAI